MISALKWIRKGVAKETPDRFALTDAEYEAIATKIGANLSAAKSSSSSKSKASNNDDDNQMTKANAVQQQKTRKDIEDSLIPGLEEYKLEDYDDEIGHGSDGSDEDGIPQETGMFFLISGSRSVNGVLYGGSLICAIHIEKWQRSHTQTTKQPLFLPTLKA